MVLVARARPRGRRPRCRGADRLGDMRLLLLEEGHCFRDQALAFCKIPAGPRRDGLDGSSLSTLVQMVGSGIGVTLIPEMAVRSRPGRRRSASSRFPDPQPSRTVGMVWRRSSALAEPLRGVAGLVREAALAA